MNDFQPVGIFFNIIPTFFPAIGLLYWPLSRGVVSFDRKILDSLIKKQTA